MGVRLTELRCPVPSHNSSKKPRRPELNGRARVLAVLGFACSFVILVGACAHRQASDGAADEAVQGLVSRLVSQGLAAGCSRDVSPAGLICLQGVGSVRAASEMVRTELTRSGEVTCDGRPPVGCHFAGEIQGTSVTVSVDRVSSGKPRVFQVAIIVPALSSSEG